MNGDSVWLGGFRRPMWFLMVAASAVTVLIAVWLTIANFAAQWTHVGLCEQVAGLQALSDLTAEESAGLAEYAAGIACEPVSRDDVRELSRVSERLRAQHDVLDPIGMHEIIRPEGRPIVAAFLLSLLGAFVFAGVYLSDFKGRIEPEPHGFFDILSLVTSRIAMIMTAAIVLVMFFEVVSRYLFSAPTLWANELSLWIAAFVLLFSGQYAMQQRSHIRIYVLYDVMPRWAQKTCDVVSVLLILAFTFALVWGGYNDAETRFMRMETFGTAWDPPIPGIVKPAILIIICLVALQSIFNLIVDWNKLPEHHGHDDVDEHEIEDIRRTLEK